MSPLLWTQADRLTERDDRHARAPWHCQRRLRLRKSVAVQSSWCSGSAQAPPDRASRQRRFVAVTRLADKFRPAPRGDEKGSDDATAAKAAFVALSIQDREVRASGPATVLPSRSFRLRRGFESRPAPDQNPGTRSVRPTRRAVGQPRKRAD